MQGKSIGVFFRDSQKRNLLKTKCCNYYFESKARVAKVSLTAMK